VTKIKFLTLSEIIEIHKDQISRYGGAQGIRDISMLKSAAATPLASFGGSFLHPSLEEMAAAYLYHLCMNHPFVDGNKRVGLAAMLLFLDLNGFDMDVSCDELTEIVLLTASGKYSKSELAVFVKKHIVPL